MAIITINGPGGERSVQIADKVLLDELIAQHGDDVVNVDYDDDAPADGDLSSLTVAELRDHAAELGIEIPAGTRKKTDLIELIEAADDDNGGDDDDED